MIKVIEKKTIDGKVIKKYELNQGDSFRWQAIAKTNADLISKITFRLSHKGFCQLFTKEYEKQDDGSWILFVQSEETKLWEPSAEGEYDYNTEVEVTYIGGEVDTIEKAVMKVEAQIKEC